jgi:LmbE family N-acetylglucosaminyl deacetylase
MPKLQAGPARILIVLVLLLLLPEEPVLAQAPIEGDGAAALGVSLRRLGTTKRVLMIAAHPDDENTALLAELALGAGADVAYLSLTRGEGGQNLIGPELSEGLGLIRTGELLAARRLDGARQFFTRAYDFGYSRSAEETFSHWPQDTLLADVVEVVRRYRPDIILSVFSGTPSDGHGQHQAAGMLARAAFVAAGDPQRFPGQLAGGLEPHAPSYLFQSLWRAVPDAPLRVSTGDLDPLFGRSRYQIAMQSRSRHRSQDMGRAEPIGPQSATLRIVAGDYPADGTSLFAGLDTTLLQHARTAGLPAGILQQVEHYERAVHELRASFNPLAAWQLARPLAAALQVLDGITVPAGERAAAFRQRLAAERRDAADALRQAAGIVVDVVSNTPHPLPGEPFEVQVTLWNGGSLHVDVRAVELLLPDGWSARPAPSTAASPAPSAPALVTGAAAAPGSVARARFTVTPATDARPTEPYFLRAPRANGLYRWDSVPDSLRGAPFETPAVRAALRLDAGAPLVIEREAEFVDVDKAVGELRRPLIVVPAAALSVEPRIVVINADEPRPRTVTVTVSSSSGEPLAGSLQLDVPNGWTVQPQSAVLRFDRRGESRTVRFVTTPPAAAAPAPAVMNSRDQPRPGPVELRARFVSDRGTFDRGYTIIDYPHIRPTPLYRDAVVRAATFPVRIAPNLIVGYIEGAGDDGALALRQMGADVEQLDADALAGADLSRFHAIVAGIRAYEVRPDLIANNARLLDYVRNGGTFIVQYNKYELVENGFMPFPAAMARPHGRVTDPAAHVTLLEPDHPLLRGPNRITSADFDGWVQERGLYYLSTFDPRYVPLLAMADPGQEPLHGALVAAPVGSGWYVYTGLAFFRQLPEGVPGAFRLLANLVSLGR